MSDYGVMRLILRIICHLKKVRNSLKPDYPPPKEVVFTPNFASHREFFLATMLLGQAPPEYHHGEKGRGFFKFH